MAFEVSIRRDAVDAREERRVVGTEHVFDFGGAPDVEFAFLAFAVGIERSCEAAGFSDHFALEPGDRLGDARCEERLLRFAPDFGEQINQQRIVVEHLFEVRHEPKLIDRIAREAAAEMIVDAALTDIAQRRDDGIARAAIVEADGAAPEQPEDIPLRELRRA